MQFYDDISLKILCNIHYEDVTGKLTYTVERLKTQAQFDADKCLTLTGDEVDKVKAGACLAEIIAKQTFT